MAPTWFMLALLVLNLGAAAAFLTQRNGPWTLIYLGAGMIQLGCLLAKR